MPTRRGFLASSAVVLADGLTTLRGSQAPQAPASAPPATRTVQTSVLTIGYEESGSSTGFPIILLHGFPDDVRAWDECRSTLDESRPSRPRSLPSWIRPDAVSRSGRSTHGRAGGDRPGCDRFRRRARHPAIRRRRVRLGRARGVHRCGSSPRTGPSRRPHRGLHDSRHDLAATTGCPRERTSILVSVVFQHRTRPRRTGGQSAASLPAALADLVTNLEIHRRDVRENGRLVRQSRLRRCRHPFLSPSQSERARRAAFCGHGTPPG